MSALKLSANDLAYLIRPVAALASTDPASPPVLTGIHVWTGAGVVYAAATDRFVAGISRVHVPGVEPGFDTLVDVDEFRRGLQLVAPAGRNPVLTLTTSPDGLTVFAEEHDRAALAATFHLPTTDPSLAVDVVGLIGKITTGGTQLIVDPAKVDQLAAGPASESGLRLYPNQEPRRAALVSAGDDFVGAIMPIRSVDHRGFRVRDPGPNLWPELWPADETAGAPA